MLQPIRGSALVFASLLGFTCFGELPPSFPDSRTCALCHSRLPPPSGATWNEGPSIAPVVLWRGSMMANSAADPFWRAQVRYESRQAGTFAEHECIRCHAPAQSVAASFGSRPLKLDEVDRSSEGVTCSVCHQISRTGLGERSSFTGGFVISQDGSAFGPHRNPFAMPMRHHTDLTPRYSEHILEAAVCGTCHTLFTHPTGVPEGTEFLEQGTFLEWLASSAAQEGRTCQSCHMPVLRNTRGDLQSTYIAHRPPGGPFPPTAARAPFGLHLLIGGNYQISRVLGASETSERAIANLQRSLSLSASARAAGGKTLLKVTVVNLTGHKLPTGYPSRRLWLHVRAMSASGSTVFESGDWDRETGELLAGPAFQPHHRVITSAGQVQVYEADAVDAAGASTTSLTRAAGYRKDNRILPAGFDPNRLAQLSLGDDVLPVGVAGDSEFRPGQHTIVYELPPSASVELAVCYQSVMPRYATVLSSLAGFLRDPAIVTRVSLPVQ